MKLYRIWQSYNNDYDTYDSAVVVADSEEEARKMLPDFSDDGYEENTIEESDESWRSDWAPVKYVHVEELGEVTNPDRMHKHCVVSSFNAG